VSERGSLGQRLDGSFEHAAALVGEAAASSFAAKCGDVAKIEDARVRQRKEMRFDFAVLLLPRLVFIRNGMNSRPRNPTPTKSTPLGGGIEQRIVANVGDDARRRSAPISCPVRPHCMRLTSVREAAEQVRMKWTQTARSRRET